MKRRSFLKSAGFFGIASALGTFPLSAQTEKKKISKIKLKEKIILNEQGKKSNVLGDNQTLKLSATDTGGLYTTIVQDNAPGVEIPKHIHTKEDEVFHLVEGEVEIQVGNKKQLLKAGDLAFLPRGIPHSFKVVGTKHAVVHLSIFPAGIEKMFEELSELPAGPPDQKVLDKICGKYGVSFV